MPTPNRVVTVIQARVGSTRLPNKISRPLMGKPLLTRMVERVQAAKLAGTVVVATTTSPDDEAIVTLCQQEGFLYYRGDEDDLLDRHYQVGKQYQATAVVKIPSDCPLIDPAIIDKVIGNYLNDPIDFVSNLHPPTYPDGNDVEVIAMPALTQAWHKATRQLEREHTTPYLWENPDQFQLRNVVWETGLDYSMTHRWTIDYLEDYHFIKAIYEALFPGNPLFGLNDILALLQQQPHIVTINNQYAGVNWYRHHLDDLTTITSDQTRQVPSSTQPG